MGKVFFRKDKINESNRLNEIGNTPEGQFMLGRLKGRQNLRQRGEQTFGKITKTTIPVKKNNDPDFEAGEFFEDPMSWEPPYSHDDIYADGGCDVGKMEYNDEMYDFEEFVANDLLNRVRKKLQSASFLKRQPELKPEVDKILKDIQNSFNKTNEAYRYTKKQGCLIDVYDLEERYEPIRKELQTIGINANIEYPYCTDELVTISVDHLIRKIDVDLCLEDNSYKFVSMNRQGNEIFLTYTYDWDNSIFAL